MALNLFTPIVRTYNALRAKPANPQTHGAMSLVGATEAGVRVTHEAAEADAAVWACMDAIASALSSSDWNVYAGVRGAEKTQALAEDGLQFILNTRLNPEMTAQAGKRALALSAVGRGNGYAEIERDLAGRIIALWPLHPDRVEPRRDLETGRLFYRVTQDGYGDSVDLEDWEVFHIRGASLVGSVGDDMIAKAIKTIAQSLALRAFASAYFGNNAQLGTVFTYKRGKVDDTTYNRLKEQIDGRHGGVRKAFRFALLEGGEWDVKSVGHDADKAQLVDAKNVSVEEICRFFRVPPHKIAHLLRATNNNIEHQGLEFTRDCLRPWGKEIQQESDYKLVPMRGPRKFIELDLDWAEQGDYKSRAEAYQIYRANGVFSANDILRKLGENTIGPDGDIRIVQGANVRLADVGKNMAPAPAAPPADPGAGAGDESDDDVVLADWIESIYGKVLARFKARREDNLRRGKQSHRDAFENAAADARALLEDRLSDIADHLEARASDGVAVALELGEQLFLKHSPADLAGQLMDHLRGTE